MKRIFFLQEASQIVQGEMQKSNTDHVKLVMTIITGIDLIWTSTFIKNDKQTYDFQKSNE